MLSYRASSAVTLTAKLPNDKREYYFMEQLKGIKKELGVESDGKDS
jgi:ATP-dependent Lon protease